MKKEIRIFKWLKFFLEFLCKLLNEIDIFLDVKAIKSEEIPTDGEVSVDKETAKSEEVMDKEVSVDKEITEIERENIQKGEQL